MSDALIPCLVVINEFCPSVVALALDELISDLKVANIDSLLFLVRTRKYIRDFYVLVFKLTFVLQKRFLEIFLPESYSLREEIVSTLPGVTEANVQDLCIVALASLMKY